LPQLESQTPQNFSVDILDRNRYNEQVNRLTKSIDRMITRQSQQLNVTKSKYLNAIIAM